MKQHGSHRQTILVGLFFAILSLFCGGLARALDAPITTNSLASPKRGPDEELFAGPVLRLQIQISDSEFEELKKDSRQYVKATVRDGQNIYTDVGIHAKGGLGTFRPLDRNPSLTLNFDRFVKRQHFHGLDKIHLNNSVQDATYMTENICGALFRAAGVPAPRVTNARVEFNGRDLGLYVLLEGINKDFFKRFFKDTKGNLYEGGLFRDISEPLPKTSGQDPDNRSDLKLLTETASDPNVTSRLLRLGKILDLDRFISFMAMEVLVVHWDGYCIKKNNYRIYHDPATDRMTFIPHGMDQMFWEPAAPIFPNFDGLVAKSVIEVPEARLRYLERVSWLLTNVFKVADLTNKINELEAKIRPSILDFNADMIQEHDRAVALLKERIAQRAVSVADRLEALRRPLDFDANGIAPLSAWEAKNESRNASLDKAIAPDGKEILRIRTGPEGVYVASWRTKQDLASGHYRFEGLVATTGVKSIKDDKGEGVGLRISASSQPRLNKLSGDSAWTKLEYEFEVSPSHQEVELICELRAAKGEAVFDLESLRLHYHPKP
jgi:hypothetical protein